MDSAYTSLQNKVSEIVKSISTEEINLDKLKNDPYYIQYKNILAKLKGDPNANEMQSWISENGNGVMWTSSEAAGYNNQARKYITDIDSKITLSENKLISLQKNLDSAKKNLVDYEKNSPTIQAQIITDINNSGTKKYLVIGFVLVVIIGVVIYIKRLRKK